MKFEHKIMFATLSATVFCNGWYVSSYGPLIPYFSEATKEDETHYSYLFFTRSIANMAGGFFIKFLVKKLPIPTIFTTVIVVIMLSFLLASLSLHTLNLTLTLFLASVSLLATVVITYDVIFKLFKEKT